MKEFRLLDTGALTAAENVAWDMALLTAKSREHTSTPPTLRLLQYEPAAVLIGRYQSVEQEVRTSFCMERGYHINRRITGGGAILFDPSQLGWEIIASYDDIDVPRDMPARFESMCRGCIEALSILGLNAHFRPMNDIEINHRKISGTGGIDEGKAFLFQGTLLVDFDAENMIKSLRIPIEKLQDKEIESVKDRVTWLKKELGRVPQMEEIKQALCRGFETALGITLRPGEPTEEERRLFEEIKDYHASTAWVRKIEKPASQKGTLSSTYKSKGGLIRTNLSLDAGNKIIHQAFITGDFFVQPKEAVYDLEAVFKSARADRVSIEKKIDDFFHEESRHFLGISPMDIKIAVNEALKKSALTAYGFTLEEADNISTVCGDLSRIIEAQKFKLLMPYCAKQTGCGSRYEKTCPDACSACSVGRGTVLGLEYRLEAETITSFEDLTETLERSKAEGYDAFIGCCCRAFLTKHREDFERIGLPGVLIDIDSETCYDLGLEQDAYKGTFESQTSLKLDLLEKVLSVIIDTKEKHAVA